MTSNTTAHLHLARRALVSRHLLKLEDQQSGRDVRAGSPSEHTEQPRYGHTSR